MSIEVRNISKLYEEQKALDSVSFKINKGEIVGFLGPNGAGKSTTMKIITGYIPATEGEAFVCEEPVHAESINTQKKIGYLPETNPMYMDMYVREFLFFCAGIHGIKGVEAKQRVEEMIELTGLTPESKKLISSLSKGYKQRVGLAQALLHKPEVLILDEPTSGLDPNQIIEIRELIKKAGKEKTVLLSTHIMQEVQAMCDRVIVIDKGKIVADEKLIELQTKYVGMSLESIFRTLTGGIVESTES